MSWRIGVDIGGTFIDFCALNDSTGAMHTLKVLTTPDEPGREVMDGIALLQSRHGLDPRAVTGFVHGTTVGINTIIQRKGADLALITNAGFEDVIELARLRMPDTYSLFCARPEQLIPRDRIFGVAGRILADGTEDAKLNAGAVERAARAAQAAGAAGVIIAFLHAWRNPAHEQQAKAIVRAAVPDLFVFTAAEIWPVIREYERTTTGILNGYVHPRVDAYLGALEAALAQQGVPATPMITKSNGRYHERSTGPRPLRLHAAVGHSLGRDGGRIPGAPGWRGQCAHARHRRHQRRRGADHRRGRAIRHRRDDRRVPAARAQRVGELDRRWRRVDRMGRWLRRAEGGAGKRGQHARPCVLWPGRRSRHHHRCHGGAGLAGPRAHGL